MCILGSQDKQPQTRNFKLTEIRCCISRSTLVLVLFRYMYNDAWCIYIFMVFIGCFLFFKKTTEIQSLALHQSMSVLLYHFVKFRFRHITYIPHGVIGIFVFQEFFIFFSSLVDHSTIQLP